MYDKKIAYLHYIKNGELVGNAGHVKVTRRGNNFNIEVYVREAYGILNGCYYIENLGGNPFENKINIEEGQAVYKKRIEINKNNDEALPYGLKIETGKEEYLEAVWRAREKGEKEYGGKNRAVEEKAYGEGTDQERAAQEWIEQEQIGQEWEGRDRAEGLWGLGDKRALQTDWANASEEAKKKQNENWEERTVKFNGQGNEIWTDTWGSEERLAGMNLSEQKQTMWPGRETAQEETGQRKNAQIGSIQRESEQVGSTQRESVQRENVQIGSVQRENAQIGSIQRESAQRESTQRELIQKEIPQRDAVQRGTGFYKQQNSEMQIAEKNLNRQEGGSWKNLTFSVPVETYEDKWNELCKKYEVIHPFGNREEYLSLSPKDFIIFPEKYQHLVNNSFLLHGYYNYRHVILGKKEEGGKNIYYLGVPGVYYEREKMVAIMFGFEGFECGEKRAIAGGFGYYMRRVEL